MTIEQRALKLWGETDDPALGIWILADGTILNGCQGGWSVRNVDHAEIGQFFKPSVYQDPGSNWIYIKKFIKRGNIRFSLDGSECFMELYRTPGPAQWRAMGRCFAEARRLQKPVRIERILKNGDRKTYDKESFREWMDKHAAA